LSLIHHTRRKAPEKLTTYKDLISVIVPCHNEEKTIANCLQSILENESVSFEIIVVDDGCCDKTAGVVEKFLWEHKNVRLLSKKNTGKADSLNYGISHSCGKVVVCVDADSVLKKDALQKLTCQFSDVNIAAVGGNVKVANKKSLLGLGQAGEYISGLNLQRRSFDILGAMQVIPGAIGAFRKSVIEKVGGYSLDTKVEDMDITIAIQKAGYKVVYEPKAVAYTEAPENLRDFLKQRHRWVYGSFRIIAKYKDLLFSKKGGRVGNLGLTYCAIFPTIDLFLSIAFISTAMGFWAQGNYMQIVYLLGVVIFSHLLLLMYSLLIDRDSVSIIFSSIFLGVWYYHLISLATLVSIYSLITSKKEEHLVFNRLGKNKISAIA
jgi:poly-beta-1,6 N-acetyl-D-glucosamine synthase